MEFARSGDDDDSLKEDHKRSDNHDEHSVGDDDDDDDGNTHQKHDTTIIEDSPMNNNNTEKSVPEAGPSITSSAKKEEVDEKLETTKAEMGEVREENQRLKMCLNKIMNEYRVLQMKFHDIVKQETRNSEEKRNDEGNHHHQEIIEEPELISLSLGRVPSNNNIPRSEEKLVKVPKAKLMKDDEEVNNEGLTLGLDCKFETSKSGSTNDALANNNNNQSPANSSEVMPKEEAGQTWPPSKALKTVRESAEDEVSQQNPAKKARVCVRARCDTPTMNDGCQWRKYGQKIAKGNPCPRAYYRCTVAPSCPVRKQVQRCADDMSILITTYEGTHNHPLPLSATAMASTTSAAASMLLSGSTTSIPPSTTASNHNLHHPLMNLYDPSKSNQQLYLSNHHPATLSSSSSLPSSHPTITLDLTSNPSATNSSSSSSPFVRFSPNYTQLPKYPSSTSLSFSNNYSSSEPNNATMSWNNSSSSNGFLNYDNNNRNMNNILSNVNFGRQVQAQQLENLYQSIIMQKNNNSVPGLQQHALPETIAAATKAITADPSFQSALAAALSSFIGSTQQQGNNNNNNQGVNNGDGENLGLKMKLAELFPVVASSSSSSALNSSSNSSKVNNNVIGCGASSFLNKTGPVKAQNGGLMFLPTPSLPFSASKSASASPGADNRDNNN